MSVVEGLINEVSAKMGLGESARKLVVVLAKYMFDNRNGGLLGFREKFSKAGLGKVFDTWMGTSTSPLEVTPGQLQHVLGDRDVSEMASKAGVSPAIIGTTLAMLLPKLVAAVTPTGTIPEGMPDDLQSVVNRFGDADQAYPAGAAQRAPRSRRLGLWKWLLPVIVLLGLAYCSWHLKKDRHGAHPAPTTVAANPVASQVQASTAPRLDIRNMSGKVTVAGQLSSVTEERRLWKALEETYGTGTITGDLSVDPAIKPARWMDTLIAVLPKLNVNGLRLGFAGDNVKLDSSAMTPQQRFDVSQILQEHMEDFDIAGLDDPGVSEIRELKPGYGAAELASALNRTTVRFNSNTATLTRSSMDVLRNAATAINGAPPEARVTVAGHTDNQGDRASNQALSLQRAQAVVDALTAMNVPTERLRAQGNGADEPVADNRTEEGRAANRRITYRVN